MLYIGWSWMLSPLPRFSSFMSRHGCSSGVTCYKPPLDSMRLRCKTAAIAASWLRMQGTSSLLFSIFKLFFDMSLVAIDIVLLHFEELPEVLGGLKMLRLLRTAKFPTVLSAVESHFAARGSVDLFSWAGIFEGISVIILVNHGLACGIFYVGRLGKTLSLPTWLDDDDVVNHNAIFQCRGEPMYFCCCLRWFEIYRFLFYIYFPLWSC